MAKTLQTSAVSDSQGELEEPEVFDQFPSSEDKGRDEAIRAASLARERGTLRPWQHAVVKELLRSGNVTKAAAVGNLHIASLQRWRKSDKTFGEACVAALEAHVDEVEENLLKRSKGESERLIEFTLKTRRRAVYGDKVDVQVTGNLGVAVLAGADLERLIASIAPGALPVVPPLALPDAVEKPSE